jgi:hypothetical protein
MAGSVCALILPMLPSKVRMLRLVLMTMSKPLAWYSRRRAISARLGSACA